MTEIEADLHYRYRGCGRHFGARRIGKRLADQSSNGQHERKQNEQRDDQDHH